MAELIPIPSDRDLVDATREGDEAAWEELVARHHPAVLSVAQATRSSGAAHRVDAAFAQVREAISSGDVDVDAVVADTPQIRDVRCRTLAALTGRTVGPVVPPPSQRSDDVRRTEIPDRHDLIALADAFLQAPWAWQTALWHRRAECRAASEISPMLGRSANDVNATVQVAEAGLFELYLRADAARIGDLDPTSAALLPLIGGHRRNVLSPTDRRRVDELLAHRTDGSPDAIHARRWMAVGAMLDTMIPQALVPGLVGQPVERLWAVLGVAGAAVGSAELTAARRERVRRSARIGAVAAIVVAILGAAFLIRNPFDGLSVSLITDLIVSDAGTNDDADGQNGQNGQNGQGDGAGAQNGTDGQDDSATGSGVPGDELGAGGPGEGTGGPGGGTGEPGSGTGGPEGGAGGPGGGGGAAGPGGGIGGPGGGTGGPGTGGPGTGGPGTGGPGTGGPGTGGPGTGGPGTGGPGTGGPGTGGPGTGGPGTGGPGTGGPGTGGPGTGGPGTGEGVDTLDDRIDLIFPTARQGAVYVPGQEVLQLSAVLEARSDFVAGGTGTLGLAITNDDDIVARASFEIRPTAGIGLVSGGGGLSSCETAGSGPAACSITVQPGATITLTLVFGLGSELTGELEIVPSIPGASLNVPIV